MATPTGRKPTAMVATTARAVTSTTETLSEPWLATHAQAPSGAMLTLRGSTPTGSSVSTARLAVSTSVSELESGLTTSSVLPSGVIAMALLERVHLIDKADRGAGSLAYGEARRLEIARALTLRPKFVLLDEPFTGIDPITILEIQRILLRLKERGIGILISDHNVRETLNICDRAYLVYEGMVILEGSPAEIVQSSKARKLYLGESFSL